MALSLNALYKLKGWSSRGGTMAKYRFTLWQNGNPTPFFQWPALAHKTTTLGGASGAMTIWSISLKAYKSLSGLGFSTYQDAGKKRFCFLGNVGWQSVAHNSWMIQGFEHARNGECSFSPTTAAKAVVLCWKESAHKWSESGRGSFLFYACNMPFLMLWQPQPTLFENAYYIIPKRWWKKYEQRPEGYSSHVYCEGLDTEEADEGCRILEET